MIQLAPLEESIEAFDTLAAIKTQEIGALTTSIEDKTTAIKELGVQIVQMKEDLFDAEESLYEDKKFFGRSWRRIA